MKTSERGFGIQDFGTNIGFPWPKRLIHTVDCKYSNNWSIDNLKITTKENRCRNVFLLRNMWIIKTNFEIPWPNGKLTNIGQNFLLQLMRLSSKLFSN